MKETCRQCGKTTKSMYQMNEGVYCDDCRELGLLIQKDKLAMQSLKDSFEINHWSLK